MNTVFTAVIQTSVKLLDFDNKLALYFGGLNRKRFYSLTFTSPRAPETDVNLNYGEPVVL